MSENEDIVRELEYRAEYVKQTSHKDGLGMGDQLLEQTLCRAADEIVRLRGKRQKYVDAHASVKGGLVEWRERAEAAEDNVKIQERAKDYAVLEMTAAKKRVEELEQQIRRARQYADDLQEAESTFAKMRHLLEVLEEKPATASECVRCGGLWPDCYDCGKEEK